MPKTYQTVLLGINVLFGINKYFTVGSVFMLLSCFVAMNTAFKIYAMTLSRTWITWNTQGFTSYYKQL